MCVGKQILLDINVTSQSFNKRLENHDTMTSSLSWYIKSR